MSVRSTVAGWAPGLPIRHESCRRRLSSLRRSFGFCWVALQLFSRSRRGLSFARELCSNFGPLSRRAESLFCIVMTEWGCKALKGIPGPGQIVEKWMTNISGVLAPKVFAFFLVDPLLRPHAYCIRYSIAFSFVLFVHVCVYWRGVLRFQSRSILSRKPVPD